MNYLIIDEYYRIYQTKVLSGYIYTQAKKGNLSVVRLRDMKGMNIDGSWSEINLWDSEAKLEHRASPWEGLDDVTVAHI